MAAEAAKASSSSALTTASNPIVSWSPFLELAQLYHQHHLYPQYYYHVLAQEVAVQAKFDRPPHKRRKIEAGTASKGPQESTTHLWPDRRRSINFKPYSGLESVPNHPRQSQLPLKRRNDGLPAVPNYTKGSSGSSRTHVIQPDRGCTIGNLFPEILSIIFEYLDTQSKGRAAQVSKRWRDAAYKKSVWKGLTATLHVDKSNQYLPNLKDLTPSLVNRGIKHIQVLSLRERSSPRDLVKGIPNLESLNLSGCFNLSDNMFEGTIHKDVPSLTSLNLSNCKEITNSSLVTIAIRCKNLETLDLSGCTKINNDGLANLATLPKLRHLNLRSCRQISDVGIGHLCGISEVSSRPPPAASSLESLSLQDCQKLSDESLNYICKGLPNLKKINLSFCVSIGETGLKSLANLASLEDINLRSCDNIGDMGISQYLSEATSKLEKLDVSFCSGVTDATLRHLAGSNIAASLQSLALTTCAITDDGLTKVAKKLTKLRELQTGQCVNISDLSLEAIGQNMKELTLIDLYGCLRLSEAALKKLRTQLPKLTKLNLSL